MTCSASSVVVTRYPTGCFGINYRGHMFYWTAWTEIEIQKKLRELGGESKTGIWEERYYHNGRYEIPSDYRTRKFIPQNV